MSSSAGDRLEFTPATPATAARSRHFCDHNRWNGRHGDLCGDGAEEPPCVQFIPENDSQPAYCLRKA